MVALSHINRQYSTQPFQTVRNEMTTTTTIAIIMTVTIKQNAEEIKQLVVAILKQEKSQRTNHFLPEIFPKGLEFVHDERMTICLIY